MHILYRSDLKISAKMRPTCLLFRNEFFKKDYFSAMFAICMLNVDDILSEFREFFQKIDNDMDICRICCTIWRKFPEMYETESIIRDSIHFLDSLITQDASSRTTEETDEARVSKWCLRFPLPLLESGKTGYMGKEE